MFGERERANAGNQTVWWLQAPDVLPRREPAPCAHQGNRLRCEDADLEWRPAGRERPEQGGQAGPSLGGRTSGRAFEGVERVPEVTGMNDLARVARVRPTGNHVLRVRFAGDRRDREADLTGLMARSTHFKPLMNDMETFAKVTILEDGLGVAWPVHTK